MNELETLYMERLNKYITEKGVSNEFLVQLIECAGSYLNLMTISDYAKESGKSYNGIKNFRKIVKIFNVKFVIDNL